MRSFFAGRRIVFAIILVVLGIGLVVGLVFFSHRGEPTTIITETASLGPQYSIIGKSIENRAIEAYTYGQGKTHLLFVGGIHGGYEWNSVLLAYRFMDYLGENLDFIPSNLRVTVIPSANPDGVYLVTSKEGRFVMTDVSTDKAVLEAGRFNAQKIDLNRNFDCKWQPESTWRETIVKAGSKAFSEPETMAIRDFVLKQKPASVVFWHSQANAVYASECEEGILPETLRLVDAYSQASGYQAIKSFNNYEITGDAEGWLASIKIPAITVELKTHEVVEWEKNLAGIKALFKYFSREIQY